MVGSPLKSLFNRDSAPANTSNLANHPRNRQQLFSFISMKIYLDSEYDSVQTWNRSLRNACPQV